ncbi:hypothetical protein UK23_04730 [Lentzea aerocolonigenes]|uniref:Uncharacterized protein n=1 Tax=Lentzea aerocolonigenes TaxID=68170 RepID=A0A0F0H8L4_LENAE|nr:hypothetical protein UK23_04730 [Lentzea aerocolonigenes]
MAVVALTSACTSTSPITVPAPATTTTSLSPRSSLEALDERAKAAIPSHMAFETLGAGPVNASGLGPEAPVEGDGIGEVCGALLRVGRGTSVARTRTWSGGVNLFERVHVTSELPAKALVSMVREKAQACAPGAEVAVARPDGVEELFAYCGANDPGAVPWSCKAAFSRGNAFAFVVVNAESAESASLQLSAALPIFAEPLVKV